MVEKHQKAELIKEHLENIIRAIVDAPNQVQVTYKIGEQTICFEANVARPDMGKVIGKQGVTAAAIRTLLASMSGKYDQRCVLMIED